MQDLILEAAHLPRIESRLRMARERSRPESFLSWLRSHQDDCQQRDLVSSAQTQRALQGSGSRFGSPFTN